jgi:hypothetical protein
VTPRWCAKWCAAYFEPGGDACPCALPAPMLELIHDRATFQPR